MSEPLHTCKVTYSDPRVVVLDDFLDADLWARVLGYMEGATCSIDHVGDRYDRAWSWTGSPPFSSEAFRSDETGSLWAELLFPVFTQIARQLQGPLALPPWNHLRLHFQVAGAGVKLRWHLDGHCAGAFTWYAHRRWEPNWGGELLIPAGDAPKKLPRLHCWSKGFLDGVDVGTGLYIAPKPNRCVVLAPGVLHGVTRVDSDAGDNVRLGVVGFLMPESP